MIFVPDINEIKLNNSIVLVGKFDGLHTGHAALISHAVNVRKDGQKIVLIMFGTIPAAFINGDIEKRITTIDELRMHSGYVENGADYAAVCPFTKELMNSSAHDFAKDILHERFGASYVICGTDFRFGKGRLGDTKVLKTLGGEFGFKTIVVEKELYDGAEISSSRIKESIVKGDIESANVMLGHPYFVGGRIVHGRKVGRRMGFPTINQNVPADKLLPPNGVYATKTFVRGRLYQSISNIGSRPTFDVGSEMFAETNILDFDHDVYGEYAEVFFYRSIRPEKRFSSEDELADEITRNEAAVRKYFESHGKDGC